MTWTGTGRPEGRQAYHAPCAPEGGLCRSHLWPALREALVETADWLATETQRRLHQGGLAIVVLRREGLCADALRASDVVVADPCAGLDLLLHPARLVATLRR